MSKPLHVVICSLAIMFINRIECIKLTKENVNSLARGHYFHFVEISEIDPLALEVVDGIALSLGNNELTYLQEDLFNYNTKFEDLDFFRNGISEIHPLVFQKLENLTRIELSNNELTEIAENLFERNTKLQMIDFNHNSITFFHPNTFKNLKNLVHLDVSFNQFAYFDFNLLSSNKELHTLYLNKNNLIEIHYPDLKLRFPKLSSISFAENNFNCSLAKLIQDYLDKEHIVESSDSISCINDEEYAAIVSDRHIINLVISQGSKMLLNLEEKFIKITSELRNENAKMKDEIAEMQIVMKGLQLNQ